MDKQIQNSSGSSQVLENEPEIIERAKTDNDAFEVLYNFYFPRIYGYIFKRVGNHTQTEDLVSLTFLKVFTNIKEYSHQGHTFGAWVYRIATNNLTDHYRQQARKKQISLDETPNLADNRNQSDRLAKQAIDKQIVGKVMVKLPKKYQQIIHLKFFAEKESEEIAFILNISANNSRVLLHRALKKFYQIYEESTK